MDLFGITVYFQDIRFRYRKIGLFMSSEQGAALVVERNLFYRDQFQIARWLFTALIAINVMLGLGLLYRFSHPAQPEYFPATADGKIFLTHPLTDPVQNDNFVMQWGCTALEKAFSLDYLHWRQNLRDTALFFTPRGWTYFMKSIKDNNNLKTLTQFDMVSDLELTGAPQILRKNVIDGHYTWKIQVPVLIKYSSKDKNIPMSALITMNIQRMPAIHYSDKIAIDMIQVDTQGTQAS
jgi:intracellular multiplication protein IcmL